ncbi:glycosyltransferase 87 family protein [Tessaracoccus terricola]
MQSTRPAQRLLERYLSSRPARVVALLFLLWGINCLVFGIPTVEPWIPYRIDLDVYRLGAQVFRDGGDLYGALPDTMIGANLPFTYPPLAAVLFVPLTFLPFDVANVTFTLVTLAALLVTILLVAREVLDRSLAEAAWVAVALASVLLWAIPVRETVEFGQVNVVLMALVVVDVVAGRGKWWQGSLVGLAMAIKLTPAVFLAYFLARRDWRALAVGVGSALLYTGVGFLLNWGASVQYWSETLSDPARIGDLSYVSNQSLNGFINRLWLSESATTLIWFGVCAVLGLSSLWLMHLLCRRGHDGVAMLVMGFYALLASPVSWSHHWVWAVPALILLLATGLRLTGGTRVLLLAMTALGVLVFYGRPIWQVEPEPSEADPWLGLDLVLGNAYVIWGVAFFATAWVLATRAPREVREGL